MHTDRTDRTDTGPDRTDRTRPAPGLYLDPCQGYWHAPEGPRARWAWAWHWARKHRASDPVGAALRDVPRAWRVRPARIGVPLTMGPELIAWYRARPDMVRVALMAHRVARRSRTDGAPYYAVRGGLP